MFLKIFKKQKGFTVIELVVVMAIVGILSAVIGLSYNAHNKYNSVHLSAIRVLDIFREAQNKTVVSERLEVDGEMSVPKGGWGVYFEENSNKITLFADIDDNTLFDPGVDKDIVVSEIYLSDVKIESILASIEGTSVLVDDIAMFFIPPEGKIKITNNNKIGDSEFEEYSRFEITVRHNDADVEHTEKIVVSAKSRRMDVVE